MSLPTTRSCARSEVAARLLEGRVEDGFSMTTYLLQDVPRSGFWLTARALPPRVQRLSVGKS